ncbi:hypothetical protein XO10_05890 [Marinitoga sp. 1135]|uniref:HD domain-containing protein n=1 Tax=Marinitoga sp. 1135 TaxID=1643333 RepID=UPI0015860B14|nr:HD domain-containing protein [Marinitoga sp. 1135]NUU95811.1 hypothetical protein [Marinitoga sp. 1135]
MSEYKIFRDPIYGIIKINKSEEKVMLDIINTYEFQRLKRIRQLGLANYTYPSAVHDRFSHSLGVANIIEEMFDFINIPKKLEVETLDNNGEIKKVEIDKRQLKLLLKLVALLHDIGHGPFSHAFERITKVNHEEISKKIIETKNFSSIFSNIDDEILSKYAQRWIIEILSGIFRPIWVKELISSQLDADRIDYLLRDAYMCGVPYVSFDRKWLFQHMVFLDIDNEDRKGLVIDAKKGMYVIESFIISRYHMYEQVYFHKTTRGLEMVIQKIFERIMDLFKEDKQKMNKYIFNESLYFLIANNENKDLSEEFITHYLNLDEFILFSHFQYWIKENFDEVLTSLCRTIIYREPFKIIKEVENEMLFDIEQHNKIKEILGENAKYFYLEDNYRNVPYKDTYLLGKTKSEDAEHIWLKEKNKIIELATKSHIIGTLRNNNIKKSRAYVHQNYVEKVSSIIEN